MAARSRSTNKQINRFDLDRGVCCCCCVCENRLEETHGTEHRTGTDTAGTKGPHTGARPDEIGCQILFRRFLVLDIFNAYLPDFLLVWLFRDSVKTRETSNSIYALRPIHRVEPIQYYVCNVCVQTPPVALSAYEDEQGRETDGPPLFPCSLDGAAS